VLQVAAVRVDEAREVLNVMVWALWRRIWRADRAMPSPWRQTARWSIPRRASNYTAVGAKYRSGCSAARQSAVRQRGVLAVAGCQGSGLHARLTYDPADNVAAPHIARGSRPAVAVLREQG